MCLDVLGEAWYRQYLKEEMWSPGTVMGSLGRTNYKVLDGSGKQVHRHVDQLRHRSRNSLMHVIQ